MNTTKLQAEVQSLSAKITALTMFVDMLLTRELARQEDPALIGKHLIDNQFGLDEVIRKKVGENAFALEISEMVSSTIDRAVAKAVAMRERRARRR